PLVALRDMRVGCVQRRGDRITSRSETRREREHERHGRARADLSQDTLEMVCIRAEYGLPETILDQVADHELGEVRLRFDDDPEIDELTHVDDFDRLSILVEQRGLGDGRLS